MAHKFDSGAPAPQRTRIQQGALALLSGLRRSDGGYLLELQPFGGVISGKDDDAGAAQLISILSRMPAIAVALGDRTSVVTGMGGYQETGEIDLLIYFASSNARNMAIGRQQIDGPGLANDHSDPGLHIMMEHAKELLLGQFPDVGSDIKQLRPFLEQAIFSSAAMTVWLQTYKVTVNTRISEFRTVKQLLTSIRFRAAQDPAEVHLPAAATKTATIDVNTDNL